MALNETRSVCVLGEEFLQDCSNYLVSFPGPSVALEDPPGATLQKSKYSWLPAHIFTETLLL